MVATPGVIGWKMVDVHDIKMGIAQPQTFANMSLMRGVEHIHMHMFAGTQRAYRDCHCPLCAGKSIRPGLCVVRP